MAENDDLRAMLNAAIKMGETNADMVARYGAMTIEYRRTMERAIRLLDQGRADQALWALRGGLKRGDDKAAKVLGIVRRWREEMLSGLPDKPAS